MVQSINSKADYSAKAHSFHAGIGGKQGSILIGNNGFEFFNERNLQDYLQIPWEEIHHVEAQLLFGGKVIRSFSVTTKQNGKFSFTSKNSGRLLKTMGAYLAENQLLKALTIRQKIQRFSLFKKKRI